MVGLLTLFAAQRRAQHGPQPARVHDVVFVGHEAAGENLAGLYALVATCEANGVNPTEYLADVLMRVQTHPATRIDELLPHRWRPVVLAH